MCVAVLSTLATLQLPHKFHVSERASECERVSECEREREKAGEGREGKGREGKGGGT